MLKNKGRLQSLMNKSLNGFTCKFPCKQIEHQYSQSQGPETDHLQSFSPKFCLPKIHSRYSVNADELNKRPDEFTVRKVKERVG